MAPDEACLLSAPTHPTGSIKLDTTQVIRSPEAGKSVWLAQYLTAVILARNGLQTAALSRSVISQACCRENDGGWFPVATCNRCRRWLPSRRRRRGSTFRADRSVTKKALVGSQGLTAPVQLTKLLTHHVHRRRLGHDARGRPIWRMAALERLSRNGGCTFKPVIGGTNF